MKRFIYLLVLINFSCEAYAQKRDSLAADDSYYRKIGEKDTIPRERWLMRFGFSIGPNLTSDYITDPAKRIGFSMGIATEYRFSHRLSLVPQLIVSLISYKRNELLVENAILETPLFLVYKPFNTSYRPVITGGPNYKLNLFPLIPAGPSPGWCADIAIGFEKRSKYFTCMPLLRYSYGEQVRAMYVSVTFF